MRGFATALKTLTIIPVEVKEEDEFSLSLPWFPLVGLALGLLLLLIGLAWIKILAVKWPGGGAVVLLAAEIVFTGGLHLDGLADWADTMGGYGKKESRLAIMKDSNVGAFAVLAIVIILLAKWVALKRLFLSGTIIWFLPILIISRGMMVELITTLPYARSGDGMARPFVERASAGHRMGAHAITLCLCACLGPAGLALFMTGWFVTRAIGVSFKKSFGGITGDLLGATNEMVEAVLLMICALPGGLLLRYTYWSWILS